MTIFIYRNFFRTLPNELIEASRIDGCTEIQTFTKVTLPLILPATATNGILIFVGWWGELLWASIELDSDIVVKNIINTVVAMMRKKVI